MQLRFLRRRVDNFPNGAFLAIEFTGFAKHIKAIFNGESHDFAFLLNAERKGGFNASDEIFRMRAYNLIDDGHASIFDLVKDIHGRKVFDDLQKLSF